MKVQSSKPFFHVFVLFSLLTALFGLQPTMPAQAAGKLQGLPVKQFLKPDGTLNLATGYIGSMDISNYAITLDPARGPLFRPLMSGSAWNALGAGVNNNLVFAIAINGNDVYVGGSFTHAGGIANANYIAKWNGSAWSAVGTGLDSFVYALAVSGTDVYVGGSFTNAGGDPNADGIAKWDGSAWSALGIVSTMPYMVIVDAIAVSGNNVYIGGGFTHAGGVPTANYIAKWDGAAWSGLGMGLSNIVHAIAVSGTDIYVGGEFTYAGGVPNANYIAKWDGTAWSALGAGLNASVQAIAISGPNVYVGGYFTDAGGHANADYMAKWNGTTWFALGTTPLTSVVFSIATSGPDVYAGGQFFDLGGDTNKSSIAKWNGAGWSALSGGLKDAVYAIAISGPEVYAGGKFINAGGKPAADRIARYGPNLFTTVLKSSGAQDGWILESSENSNKGRAWNASAATIILGDDASKKQYLGILSFSTGASLPDTAVITKVTLKVKQLGVVNSDLMTTFQGLMVDVKKGFFGATELLQASDFQAAASASYGPFSPTPVNYWYNIDLTSAKGYINNSAKSSGLTQIRLRFKLDDNNDAFANVLNLFSGNAAVASRPQLIIQYYVP